jgi:organic radical activating enzyme
MGLRFNGLALVLTNKCNARCAHCYGNYGPSGRSRLPIDQAISLLDQALTIECVGREFVLAGGEVFLFYDDVLTLVRYAASQGFRPSITTNGFWGNDLQRAYSWMKQLKDAGLVKLEISVDPFHQEYIPVSAPRNVIRAAKRCGLETIMLRCQVTKQARLDRILADFDVLDLANTIIVSSPVVPMGRAEQEIPMETIFTESASPLGCCVDALILTVTVEGDVFPCCAGSELCPPLRLGNISEETLCAIVKRAQGNFVLRTLATIGPNRLAELLRQGNLGYLLLPGYTNACHLCYHIFSHPQLSAYVVSCLDARAAAVLDELSWSW